MDGPIIFLTRRIPDAGLTLLASACTVMMHDTDQPISEEELRDGVHSADGLLCLLTDGVHRGIIDAAPRLRVISNYAVGYNNIDIEAARARGIVVTNTPGVLTDATADLAFALLAAVARRIAESDRWLRTHRFTGWAPMLFTGHDISGATLGIVGAGRIGEALAKRAAAGFDMRIVYTDATANPLLEDRYGAHRLPLDALLGIADFVSIHVPLTGETQHLIGARELGLMKPDAVLINTARGPIVDEAALIDALRNGGIAGAGLDVYEHEPAIPDVLRELDNVVILPHIGSASIRTRERMAVMAAQNILNVLQGHEPVSRVV